MKHFIVAALFALFFLSFQCYSETSFEEEENVLVLGESNFAQAIESHPYILVEFYAPWCGHCKRLAPEYAAAATQLKEEGSTIKLAKVDATVHMKLAKKHGVSGYPTLKFFKNGKSIPYNGDRVAAGIINWLKKKTGPAVQVVADEEALTKLKESLNVVVVGFFDKEDTKSVEAFNSAASSREDVVFASVSERKLLSEDEASSSLVVVFKKFDEHKVLLQGEALHQVDNLNRFVNENQFPLVNEFEPAVFQSPIKHHFFLFLSKASADFAKTVEALKQVATVHKGKALFTYLDVDSPSSSKVFQYFGVTPENLPQVVFFNLENMLKYHPADKLVDAKAWEDFVTGVFAGTVKPFLKSEEPVAYSGKGVQVVTGKDHDSVVKDPSKDVFVEYYAPWCGHCKNLAPIWESLAAAYDNEPNLVIAKMDATANEVETVAIEGFPTLIFYPAGQNKKALAYEGARTLEAFKSFLDKKSRREGFVPASDDHKEEPNDDDDEDEQEEEEELEVEDEHEEDGEEDEEMDEPEEAEEDHQDL